MAAFQVMNQDFKKLDRFDGMNFTRWQDKMMFLLTALKVQYVLDPNLPPLLEITNNDSDETKAARKKREEDELVCRGHILNALSDGLYDLFTSSKCPKEIRKALENKYNNEKQGADKFLTLKYFEFTMNDSESVMDQVHQLQILVSKLKDLKVEIGMITELHMATSSKNSDWCVFVGYAKNSKAYRLLDLESNVIIKSRDVEFIENKFNSDSDFSAPTISLETDSNIGSSRENENVVPNNTTEPRRSQRARKEKILDPGFIDSQAIAFLLEGDRDNVLKEIPMLLNVEDDPKTYSEAMASRDIAFWKEAVNDEMDSILCNNTWVLVELPQGSKPIG
ncbi:hypothetical protein RJ639_029336 [Escallonia herrerae]|uniref:Retroviral polymerase SH3-like domain-containing protein n=1 Tax=Escallonia herrerae TaxID=1293975 RepID=A0AA89BNW8_9ASTE|nr:hypothetical protein RJ639_029336 [Escallonia herrerae]